MKGIIIFVAIAAVLAINLFAAITFDKIAVMKGQPAGKYIWWCFLLGIVGWLMVVALPDRASEKQELDENSTFNKQGSINAEKAKQDRIAVYWAKHPGEERALREKRSAAESKLKDIGGLAIEQRKTLQNLISAIDNELTRDREG